MTSQPADTHTRMRVAGIIAAAGSGTRLGAAIPKAFVELAGLSLLTRSAHALSSVCQVLVIATPESDIELAASLVAEVDAEIHIVSGGANRQDSVAAALKVIDDDVDFVLVHDAARALVPIDVCESVVATLVKGAEAVIPVLPVVDTIRRVNVNGNCLETLDRSLLRRVQTPQGFSRKVLLQAYSDPTHVATDDAGLVEQLGVTISTVTGDERAMKITTPDDLLLVAGFLGES